MFTSILQFFKNITYKLLRLFFGDQYCSVDDLKNTLNTCFSEHVNIDCLEKIIQRIKTIDIYLGIDFIDPDHELDIYFQQFICLFNNELISKTNQKHCIYYFEILVILMRNNQFYILPGKHLLPVRGVKKIHNRLVVIVDEASSTQINKINTLNLSYRSIFYFLVYNYQHNTISSHGQHITFAYMRLYKNLMQHYQTIHMSLKQAISKKWFKWLFGTKEFYDPLMNNLTWLHDNWLLSERSSIESKWIDPWAYKYDQNYMFQVNTYLNYLNIPYNGKELILKYWHNQWLSSDYILKLDWFDVLFFDAYYNDLICDKWPLFKCYKDIIFNIKSFDIYWSVFKRAFIDTDLNSYKKQKLIFWQRKIIKLTHFLHKNEAACQEQLLRQFNSKDASLLRDEIKSYKDTCWQYEIPDMLLKPHVCGEVYTSQLLQYYIDPNRLQYFNVTQWLVILRFNTDIAFHWCFNNIKINEVLLIQSQLPSKFLNDFHKYIFLQLSKGVWSNASYRLIINNPHYNHRLINILFDQVMKLSNLLEIDLLKNKAFESYFLESQNNVYTMWLSHPSCSFNRYASWLNDLILNNKITLLSLKNLVTKNVQQCTQDEALNQLSNVNDFQALHSWIALYVEQIKEVPIIQHALHQKLYGLIKSLIYENKLGLALKNSSYLFSYQDVFNSFDFSFITYIYKHHKVIDNWLITASTLLLNELWNINGLFVINPFLRWLHIKKIYLFSEHELNLLNQIYNLHVKKKSKLVPCLKYHLDHLKQSKELEEECWQTLDLIQREEKTYEHRSIQKEYFSSMRIIPARNQKTVERHSSNKIA